MNQSENQRVSDRPPHYNRWVAVFWVLAVTTAGLFFYATQRVEYVWRWNRIPIYFAYEDTIDVVSEIEGDVESITRKGNEAVITVKGLDGSESYTVPADGVVVVDGEVISLEDILATYTRVEARSSHPRSVAHAQTQYYRDDCRHNYRYYRRDCAPIIQSGPEMDRYGLRGDHTGISLDGPNPYLVLRIRNGDKRLARGQWIGKAFGLLVRRGVSGLLRGCLRH